ncbi:hypothetical protein [Streptomyces sp. C184]|uniref:hypothetical protein n=1 Tax=Streptomyces sp. C184 TaxID=3237121 RepID=UPI0034C6336F
MSSMRMMCAVGGAVVAEVLLFGAAPTASADQIRDDQWPLTSFDAESVDGVHALLVGEPAGLVGGWGRRLQGSDGSWRSMVP